MDKDHIIQTIKNIFIELGAHPMSEYNFKDKFENGLYPEDILWVPNKYYYHIDYQNDLSEKILIKYSSDLGAEFKIFSVIPADLDKEAMIKEVKAVLSGWSPEQEAILQKYIDVYAKEDFPYDIQNFIFYTNSSEKISSLKISKKDPSSFDYEEGLDMELDYLYLCFLQHYEDYDYAEASNFITRLYCECAARLGPNHPNTMAAMWYIRALLPRNDEDGLALITDIKLYQYASHKFGNSKTPTLYVIMSIAMDLSDVGNFQDAIEIAKFALEQCKKRYGHVSKETLEAKHILGIIYHNADRIGLALSMFEECQSDSAIINGKLSLTTLAHMEYYADELCHELTALYADAIEVYLVIYHTLKELYSDYYDAIINTADTIAMTYLELHELVPAINYESDALDLANEYYEIDDDYVLYLYSHYSMILSELGEHAQAYKIDCSLYGKYLREYGEFDQRTLNAMDSIIIDCYHMKDFETAKQLAYNARII